MSDKKIVANNYTRKMNLVPTRPTKTQTAWSITKFISSFLWGSSKFVVKNTPAALGMAWEVKKEISNNIAKEIEQVKKEQKQLALEEKIAQLKAPKGE